jgi:hypothetical protein
VITSANALKWSMWLAATHPAAFKAVLQQVSPRAHGSVRAGTPAGFGSVSGTYIPRAHLNMSSRGTRRAPGVGSFGDDISPDVVTVEAPAPDFSSVDMSSIFSDPTLQDINVNLSDVSSNVDLGAAAAATDTSGGFWSSLGSGLSSIGGGLVSAIGSVAGAVVNPQTLGAAGNVAAAVIKANAASSQSAQMQQAVLQQQMQRTATGAGAAPIRYMTNPATGQTVPYYYNSSTGQYQANQPGFFSSLFSSSPAPVRYAPGVAGAPAQSAASGITQYLPYILMGGGLLLVVAFMKRT